MQWLDKLVDDIEKTHPTGEILIESGSAPSGTYHLGHLREIITCDAILLELKRRGRNARHISFIDDLDALRKIPVNVPKIYAKYLGQSLCDIPAPEGEGSYANYFLGGFERSAKALGIEMEVVASHEKYRVGYFSESIELALDNADKIREILQNVSGHQLDENWSPIQINEDGYLKKRRYISLDKKAKTLTYEDKDGNAKTTPYDKGEVKLDWRIDWPARWAKLGVHVEPFGRDHATKGGSYDTGAAICRDVFGAEPPIPVPYDFVNLAGDTKKMSASKGSGIDAETVVKVLPPEIVRFFMLRYPPAKRLYFDPVNGVAQLIDDFAELMNNEPDSRLIEFSRRGTEPIVSRIPFSHLVASYQAALRDPAKTIEVVERTEQIYSVEQNEQLLKDELKYIEQWLKNWAPEEVKFELAEKINPTRFSQAEKDFLTYVAEQVDSLPDDAEGEDFHKIIYESPQLEPKERFAVLYRALIDKDYGPRAGWFLAILPREWLVKRLRLKI